MLHKKINNKISLIAYLIANGISIPHYCYHNDLSIAGNCRICLVELKNSMKPVVSCATNARTALYNNSLYYDSALIKKARENILEFLLLNHPLDCPVCDQGGDCDLQDQSLFFGFTKRRFYKYKRIVSDKNLGLVVKTVMTRCIHCTRCIRFAAEIAGVEELGVFGRGVGSEIGTYINKILTSELSGNVIDLCPVAKVTGKLYAPANDSTTSTHSPKKPFNLRAKQFFLIFEDLQAPLNGDLVDLVCEHFHKVFKLPFKYAAIVVKQNDGRFALHCYLSFSIVRAIYTDKKVYLAYEYEGHMLGSFASTFDKHYPTTFETVKSFRKSIDFLIGLAGNNLDCIRTNLDDLEEWF